MKHISLNGAWELTEAGLRDGVDAAPGIAARKTGWVPCAIPGDVKDALFRAGRLKDPLVGTNSLEARWTESRSWWLRKRFAVPAAWVRADRLELALDGLDVHADIFLNGKHLAHHPSAFRPFEEDVKDRIIPGAENEILVRLTSGLERFRASDAPRPESTCTVKHGRDERGDVRRVFLRKPQYTLGWDWAPRLATCGIAFGAAIRSLRLAAIRSIHPVARLDGKHASIEVTVEVDVIPPNTLREGTIAAKLTDEAGKTIAGSGAVLWRTGLNYPSVSLRVPAPRLWWPNGAGESHLYKLEVTLGLGKAILSRSISWGLRTVALDATEDRFAIAVNGQRLFVKGGNWVPPDALYARIPQKRQKILIREAVAANLNTLRIWGGGFYAPDEFLELCDRAGLMVFHDFMFACGAYPDHLEWFREEVAREADYQTKRLRRFASLVFFDGNNECHSPDHSVGCRLYEHILPEAVRRNCPEIPYWNGSPYGGPHPNMDEFGDCHHWWPRMNTNPTIRLNPEKYDNKDRILFSSEYGYLGPTTKSSVLRYLDARTIDTGDEAWFHHTNTTEDSLPTLLQGIDRHYRDTTCITPDDMLLYGGLCQGLFMEYAADSFRSKPHCNGAIFWMFNDCWGETGWSIVDYYLQRKIAFYFLKRAFAPVRLILRRKKNAILITLANDLPRSIGGALEAGALNLQDGGLKVRRTHIRVPAFSRAVVAYLPAVLEREGQLVFARMPGGPAEPAMLKPPDLRKIEMAEPEFNISARKRHDGLSLAIGASCFVHAVHLILPGHCSLSDNYFDLFPGTMKTVDISGLDAGRASALPLRAIRFSAGQAAVIHAHLRIPSVL